MKKAITVATVLAAVVAVAGWQGTSRAAEKAGKGTAAGGDEATITKLSDQLRDAALKGDVATIEQLHADDYVAISAVTGATSTKAELLNNYKSGKLKYEAIDVSDTKVHFYGPTTALVTAKAVVKGKLGTQDFSGTYRSSRLWVKRDGKWQTVFFQSTKVPSEVRPG